MTRDRGVVLINALVIVLVISSVAAALLTRAEGARVRSAHVHGATQAGLYLDAAEALLPALLAGIVEAGEVVHPGQPWGQGQRSYRIDRGQVTATMTDLQGRLNVNWLANPDDVYALETFQRLFNDIGLPVSLLGNIADFVGPDGPRDINSYLGAPVRVQPRGGPVKLLEELRHVTGMTPEYFGVFEQYVSALPFETRLNLNTAQDPVLRAVLEPFPEEQVTDFFADRDDGPIMALSDFRNRTIEILETEDIEYLPFDKLTVTSFWFDARMRAELSGKNWKRHAILFRDTQAELVRVAYRWAVFD